jgi:hypothetical protein
MPEVAQRATNPFGLAFATAQTQMGLGLEISRGTAATPLYYLPVRAPKYKPDRMYLPDQSLQGSMVQTYNMTPAMRYDSHGWDSYIYLDHFPLLVAMELGSQDFVTAAIAAGCTLAQAVVPGNNTIIVTAAVPTGSFFTLGTQVAGTLETHMVASSTGTAPSVTLTLSTATIFPHASGDPLTGLTKHTFSLLNNAGAGNQPPSGTIWDYDGDQWRQLTASQLDALTLKGNATALAEYTSTWFCNPSVTPTPPTPSYTTAKPVPSYTTSLTLGGTQVTAVEEYTLDFKRGVKPIPALTGTQEYFEYFAGPIQTTGNKFTAIVTAGNPLLTYFQNGTIFPVDFLLFDNYNGWGLDIHCSQSIFTACDVSRSKEWVEDDMTIDFLPSTTDAKAGGVSPLLISIGNNVTTPYS